MKNSLILILGATFLIIINCTTRADIEAAKVQVKTVIDQYKQVLETEDMELLSSIMAHDPDMISFGTDVNERIIGWEGMKDLMQKQFAITDNSKLTVKNEVIKVHDSGKVAWFSEVIDWDMDYHLKPIRIEGIRLTGVLEKQNNNWLIVQLHFSIPVENPAFQG
jgi:ketosteroid isomerase-like protein